MITNAINRRYLTGTRGPIDDALVLQLAPEEISRRLTVARLALEDAISEDRLVRLTTTEMQRVLDIANALWLFYRQETT